MRVAPGGHSYRGYGEWGIHPDEAIFLLHRGYALVNGERKKVRFIYNDPHVAVIWVESTYAGERPPDRFVDCAEVLAA